VFWVDGQWKKPVSKLERRFVTFANLVGIGVSFPITSSFIALRWLFPCGSMTFGYQFFPECKVALESKSWSFSSNIILGLIMVMVFWLIIDSSGSFAMFITDCTFMQAYCMRRYVQNITGMLNARPEMLPQFLRYYKQLQILSRYYNLIQQDTLVVAHLLMEQIAIVLCFYSLISLGAQLPLAKVGFFLVGGFDGAVALLVVSSVLAQLHNVSKDMKSKLRKQTLVSVSPRQRRWIRQCIRSLLPLKSYIGQVNYVDELTPLVMMDFSISQTVSLLMMH